MSITQDRLLALLRAGQGYAQALERVYEQAQGLEPKLAFLVNQELLALSEAKMTLALEAQAYKTTASRNKRLRRRRHLEKGILEGENHYALTEKDGTLSQTIARVVPAGVDPGHTLSIPQGKASPPALQTAEQEEIDRLVDEFLAPPEGKKDFDEKDWEES